jgi:hypothetical protein
VFSRQFHRFLQAVDEVMMNTPILFLIFNRPLQTSRVFEVIRQVEPERLFVAADGPRNNVDREADQCTETRAVVDKIDWNCDLRTLFRNSNLGCKKAVSSAIDWFFGHVEEGIVLEDDCLPHPSFFPYCEELLERYRYDTRVMQICGLNVLQGWKRLDYSYYFSAYGPVWGWAGWRRAWKYYDVDIKLWPSIRREGLIEDICLDAEEIAWRQDIYEKLYKAEIDTWDLQWGFAKMINSGLCITPTVNLISNIGFGRNATHTLADADPFGSMPTANLQFPLRHPPHIIRDRRSDKRYFDGYVLRKKI